MARYREDGRGSEDRGGESTALARTSGTTANAAPVTNLQRDPGREIKVIVPATALALSTLAETIDGVVTDVQEDKKIKIALQKPHLHPDQWRRYNFLNPLSHDHSI